MYKLALLGLLAFVQGLRLTQDVADEEPAATMAAEEEDGPEINIVAAEEHMEFFTVEATEGGDPDDDCDNDVKIDIEFVFNDGEEGSAETAESNMTA